MIELMVKTSSDSSMVIEVIFLMFMAIPILLMVDKARLCWL
jgi:hypothetical protein